MGFPTTKTLRRNGMGNPKNGPISAGLSRELARMDVERARWIHGHGSQVRTLADMDASEIATLEAHYGAKVRAP